MGHPSKRQRIAPAAKPARAVKATKVLKAVKPAPVLAAGKPAKKPAPKLLNGRTRRVETPARMKIVWEVGRSTGATLKTFPYAEKAAAEAAVLELTRSTGKLHMLRAAKVPMGADE